jgi:hypothetical protein
MNPPRLSAGLEPGLFVLSLTSTQRVDGLFHEQIRPRRLSAGQFKNASEYLPFQPSVIVCPLFHVTFLARGMRRSVRQAFVNQAFVGAVIA